MTTPNPFPTVAGGLRTRLIFDSLFYLLRDCLTQIGWINGNPNSRRHQPIHFIVESQEVTTEVPVNTLALSDENISSTPWEVGSQLTEDTRYYFVDFFGESDPVGKHLIGDVRDILAGKFASLGRVAPVVDVHDWRINGNNNQGGPLPQWLFSCDIVNITVDRAHGWREPWLAHWYSIQFAVLDYYNSDADAPVLPTAPAAPVVQAVVGMGATAGL